MKILRDASSLWLFLWTINNVSVTLLNKTAFATVDFNYPYCLSFVHMVCNSLGTQYVFWSMKRDAKTGQDGVFHRWLGGHFVRKDLDGKGTRYIWAFSILFSLNIAIGNVSLRHVSVNFNQVMRSLVPAITILFGIFVGRSFTFARVASVLPIIVGVAMACYGDMTYTPLGFLYTILCVVLAAVKVVTAGEMLTGALKLHPVDLLGHLAPLAMGQCLLMSVLTGEVREILSRPELYWTDIRPILVVCLSGVFSFSLNITSLMANKLTSPLTLCIAGNVKQVLMIAFSTMIFQTPISPLNGQGIAVVLIGSSLYSYVALRERQQPSTTCSNNSNKTPTKTRKPEDDDTASTGAETDVLERGLSGEFSLESVEEQCLSPTSKARAVTKRSVVSTPTSGSPLFSKSDSLS